MAGMAFDGIRRGHDHGLAAHWAGSRSATAGAGGRAVASSPVRPGGATAGRLRPSAVPVVQRSLALGRASDPCEREADAMASAVVPALRRAGGNAALVASAGPSGRQIRRRAASAPAPGAVSAATEAGIRSARAGGTPLEGGPRRSLERAFGADFSAVRLHVGPAAADLNRQVGAIAFTAGTDIFFRGAAPDLSSEAGQHLLAHELTHTLQQGPSAQAVQRKIGFEFETGIPAAAKKGSLFMTLLYQEELFTASNGKWKVTADNGTMEFVTEPFEETLAGLDALFRTMDDLVEWAGLIPAEVKRAAAAGTPKQGRVDGVGPAFGTTHSRSRIPFRDEPYVIYTDTLDDADINAAPQATGGVTLDQIPALIDTMMATEIGTMEARKKSRQLGQIINMSDAKIRAMAKTPDKIKEFLEFKQELLDYGTKIGTPAPQAALSLVGGNIDPTLKSAQQMAVRAVNLRVAGLPGGTALDFGKLKGLLTLVISYLLSGDRASSEMPYAKAAFALMARTSFYAMFRLLGQHEKDLFTEDFVLAAADLSGTGNEHVFVRGFKHTRKTGEPQVIEYGPSRSQWIDSIREGSPGAWLGTLSRNPADLLSQGSGSVVAQNSISLGAMNAADFRATGERDLVVLELRSIPKKAHRLEWTDLAVDVFTAILRARGL